MRGRRPGALSRARGAIRMPHAAKHLDTAAPRAYQSLNGRFLPGRARAPAYPVPTLPSRSRMPPVPSPLRRLTVLALLVLVPAAACTGGGPRDLAGLEARLQQEPGDTESALQLAAQYRAAGRLDDARVLLERTAANAPRDGRVLLLLGITYEDLGRFDDARRLYAQYQAAGGAPELSERVAGRMAVVERQELRRAATDALAREATLAAGEPSPSSVAVFPFLYSGTDPRLAPLGRALAEMLSTDLAQTSRLTVLERARVQALLDEIGLAESGLTERSSGVRAGRLLSAGTVVQGRIGGGGDAVRLEALVVGAGQGDPAAADPIAQEVALQRLLDAEKELALGIYARLGIELTAAERERVGKRMTENVQALLVFGAALEASDRGDFVRAAELFRQAAEMDRSFDAARVRAAAANAAARTTGAGLAAVILAPPVPTLDVGDVARLPIGRDPTSEALGSEGLSRPRATIEIILRRP